MKLRHYKKNVAGRIRFNSKQGYGTPGLMLAGGARSNDLLTFAPIESDSPYSTPENPIYRLDFHRLDEQVRQTKPKEFKHNRKYRIPLGDLMSMANYYPLRLPDPPKRSFSTQEICRWFRVPPWILEKP